MLPSVSDTACRIHVSLSPARIIYVNGVLDSYEGLGIMRTADEHAGKIIIYTTNHAKQIVLELLEAMKAEDGLRLEVTAIDNEDVVG